MLFLYLSCGFLCLTPLFRLTNRDTVLRVQAPNGVPAATFILNNVPGVVLVAVAILLYIQGFAVLLACTRTDFKSHVVRSMFPFLLCAVCTTLWKKPERSDDDCKKLDVVGEPLVLLV